MLRGCLKHPLFKRSRIMVTVFFIAGFFLVLAIGLAFLIWVIMEKLDKGKK